MKLVRLRTRRLLFEIVFYEVDAPPDVVVKLPSFRLHYLIVMRVVVRAQYFIFLQAHNEGCV